MPRRSRYRELVRRLPIEAALLLLLSSLGAAGLESAEPAAKASGLRVEIPPPPELGDSYRFAIQTPDEDIDRGAELAVGALWRGATRKAGVLVPTVSGAVTYPAWVHPYDNYWINRVSSYFFPRESTEWPIRLFAVYQAPCGEIGGGVYDIPEAGWWKEWEEAGGPVKWQPRCARPIADHVAALAAEPRKIQYGIYVRDHLFVLQVHDQWRARGSLPFLIEMYGPCRRALKYLERERDQDSDGLIETTCVLSDLVVAGDQDIHSTERAEDQVMLYGALRAFSEMARKLGGGKDAEWADRWAGRIRDETIRLFWRPEGRLIFGVEREGERPRLEYVTTTYADGYAILFGLVDEARSRAILDFMARQEFVVPGPYHIPPVRAEDKPQNPPGVYCNGGCGWGRGIMPSVALACFEAGRVEQGLEYLKRQAAAARKAGSFHEYWTWETYAGKTEAGGAPWYGETSAGYLDALLHGLFGIASPEPGFRSLRLAPRFPTAWPAARLEIRLPGGERLAMSYRAEAGGSRLEFETDGPLFVEVVLPWARPNEPKVDGDGILQSRVEGGPGAWRAVARFQGRGGLRIAP